MSTIWLGEIDGGCGVILHPVLRALFTELDDAGISWCVLRGEGQLDGTSRDVDLLVARSQIPQLSAVLEHLRFGRIRTPGHGVHSFFVTYHAATDKWIKLDVVIEIMFGPYQTVETDAADGILMRKEQREGIPLPAPSDAFWCLLLHCMLDKESIDSRHRDQLEQLVVAARESNPTGAGILPADLGDRFRADDLLARVEVGAWQELEQVGPAWRRACERRQRRAISRYAANRALRLFGAVVRVATRPGFAVALLGPDGAGKTTLARALTRSFHPTFSTRYVYMGFGQSDRSVLNYSIPGVSMLVTMVRYFVGFVHVALGRIVIFDRYAYDAFLPSLRRRNVREQAHRWFLSHVHPTPDAVLILDSPADVLYARRPEHALDELERDRQVYSSLASKLSDSLIVDGSGSPEELRREALGVIWRLYSRRLSPRPLP
jgi:thymidylate kinase